MTEYEDLEPIPDGMVEVYSRRNAQTKQNLLDTCTVFVGGMEAVHFDGGRALVPATIAPLLAARGDVIIPSQPAAPAPVTGEPLAVPEELAGLPTEALQALVALVRNPAAANAALQAAGVDAGLHTAPDTPPAPAGDDVEKTVPAGTAGDGTRPEPGDEAALDAARAFLDEEGDEPPETEAPRIGDKTPPAFPIAAGFQAFTIEDERRCVAAKGDGSQCNNPAKPDGWACGLSTHQAQVTELASASATTA